MNVGSLADIDPHTVLRLFILQPLRLLAFCAGLMAIVWVLCQAFRPKKSKADDPGS